MLFPLLFAGCAYKVGSGLVAGALDEIGGEGRTDGVETMADSVLERQILAELGHQLGSGLSTGATDITPEQQQRLEAAIDGLITVAALRAGQGIRNEVSPQMREMIRKDIVLALSEGFRGEISESLEEMVDRVISKAAYTLKTELRDEELKFAFSDLLRESIYIAMREGQGNTPAVGETIEETLTTNLLMPIEESVGTLTQDVSSEVDYRANQTEKRLSNIISGLVVAFFLLMIGAAVVIEALRRRAVRAQAVTADAVAQQKSINAALDLLDDATRARILEKASQDTPAPATAGPKKRSDDYFR
ncbi:MAG: hypothetical protein H0V89_10755 [Deltaproteobacteria bacterium]|nr:hypothetical protein [Deltaproteobacteria bacterium]